MDELIAFLRVRWDEEEALYGLRDIAAKRQLLDWLERTRGVADMWTYDVGEPLKILASPHADHPDFKEAWRLD